MLTFSVAGSTRTMAFKPPSVIHGAPSGPTITPCGRDFSPSLMRRTCPVWGSSRPSSPERWATYQTPPSGAGATSCGCDPAGTGYSCIRGTDSSAAATVETMASANKARPRTRNLISSLFHHQLIHITPSPTFPWLNRADDGMAGRVKVLRGVFVLRGIAAADVATGEAHSQMDPAVLHSQTLFAAGSARLDVSDLIEVCAGWLWHESPPFSHLLEVLMHELDRHRALADRGSDAFDRVGPHVAGREHAGAAGLEQKRLPLAGPVRGPRQRRTGHDEA